MFAANQLGLFVGKPDRQGNQGVKGGVGRLELAQLKPKESVVSRPSSSQLVRGIRVDSAFLAAERYLLEVNTGKTSVIPVAANDASVRPFTSWVEHVPGWLSPERPLFEALLADCNWKSSQRLMYERVVDVPRMLAEPPPGARSTTLLAALAQLLSARYGRSLTTSSLALYRDGNDSVAPHGDKLGKLIGNTVVCILSLGHPRLMRLRPKAVVSGEGSRPARCSSDFTLTGGDLFVMSGRCQADWLHAIPKVPDAGARISVMFREHG